MLSFSSDPEVVYAHLKCLLPLQTYIAAPILKLWVLYCESSSPAAFNVVDCKFLNEVRIKGDPSCMVKSGPCCFPVSAKYGSNALIWQICEPVILKHNLMPLRNGSILDCLMVNQTTVGVCLLLNVISPRKRWTELSYPF